MGYQIIIAPSARGDMREIVRYVALDNRERAITFGRLLFTSTRHLADQPEMGRVVPGLDDRSLREIVVRAYRIIYRVNHERREVEIVRFWHGARGTPHLD